MGARCRPCLISPACPRVVFLRSEFFFDRWRRHVEDAVRSRNIPVLRISAASACHLLPSDDRWGLRTFIESRYIFRVHRRLVLKTYLRFNQIKASPKGGAKQCATIIFCDQLFTHCSNIAHRPHEIVLANELIYHVVSSILWYLTATSTSYLGAKLTWPDTPGHCFPSLKSTDTSDFP